ncbi:hypothetical protein B0H66DRAFT_90300 [Apodospora peruviana]|uniref:Transcription factor RfeG n=1 Tax=Apodospora peruviana TaxID=516989 RepID=A0AAE0IU02_9PEZI|nr:hypothetical protein B0H66DRAFT_90300 [Apodospora peruviana]
MATRQSGRPTQSAQAISASARQNEYFVPRDGIDREVITSDICRYLGNDALVRPGTYESPDGRTTQGYFITAYRNLTSAMIQDLKADSARWEQERRAASRSGGIMNSSETNGVFGRRSNSPLGSRDQARGQSDYSTWKNRQERTQDMETTYGSAMDIDYPAVAPNPPRAPSGYPSAPYSGVQASGYPAPAYPPQLGAAQPAYAAPNYGYAPNPQYPPQPGADPRYPGMPGPPAISAGFSQDMAYVSGSNYGAAPSYVTSGPPRGMGQLGVSSATASRTLYAPTAGSPVYGAEPADPYGYSSAATSANDPFLGRGAYNTTATNQVPASSDDLGSPAGTQQPRAGYGAVPDTQFEDPPVLQAVPTSSSGTQAQLASSGALATRRNDRESEPRERERDRDHREHRARRSEQEDRHSTRHHRGHR